MRVVDDYLIGVHDPTTDALTGGLLATIGFKVYDGQAQIDPLSDSKTTITYPVPFASYTSNVGDDDLRRLTGLRVRRSVFFSFTFVGETRTQCKWAGEALRLKLEMHRPVIAGHKCWPIGLQSGGSQRVRRDDAVMRPDGSPLFYGVDEYAVSITVSH